MRDSPETLPDHVAENRRHWDAIADDWVAMGEQAWARAEPTWGNWRVPESELRMLPEDMTGLDAIELGCGTAYVSAWMARRGADVTAIDNSEQQLATARRLAGEHGVDLTLLHGNAETVPRPDGSFDFAISEYGASIWCPPEAWLREAHRLLRPDGRLVFLCNHPMALACAPTNGAPVGTSLERDYFGLHTIDWRDVPVDPGGVNFCLPISDWMALFAEIGFVVEGLLEPRAPADADGGDFVPATWARRWPSELVWKVRKASR
ncbi:MAG: class I SAM-dependent methyltransferase [Acidimicrobiia bacterium]|nr:class I SAM-dependent methyltransferase [Acidimicrobiia bacterium]